MELRLGSLLVDSGVLNHSQVDVILERQLETGSPFGVLAEEMFGVDPEAIEQAWARQYARLTRSINPDEERFDERALGLVSRRQAWQFRVMPVRFDPVELMLATTQQHLRRALRFSTNVLGVPVFMVMCTPEDLGRGLCRWYPMPGMTPRSVNDDGMDRLMMHMDAA